MNIALLLLEIQNDYFPHGKMPLAKSLDVSAKARTVVQTFRGKNLPIIHIPQISTQPDAAFLLPCTKGADFHPDVQPTNGEMIIKKHYPNSFKDTPLLTHLKKNHITQLVICGMMTHLAIDATTRAAYDVGFSCTVLSDVCATRSLEFNQTSISEQNVHYAFLAALQPFYASVLTSMDFLQRMGARMPATA